MAPDRERPLTFSAISIGANETPLDLERLLYKGGASLRVDKVAQAINQGLLGEVVLERVGLVNSIHEFIDGQLAAGGEESTTRQQVIEVVKFFDWADKSSVVLSESSALRSYLDWAEHLCHRVNVVKDLSNSAAYSYARIAGQVLDGAIGRITPMIRLTRLRRARSGPTPQGVQADKQLLHETFAFGGLLQDICDGLPLEAILGSRKLTISLRGGGEITIGVRRAASESAEEENREKSAGPLRILRLRATGRFATSSGGHRSTCASRRSCLCLSDKLA